MRALACLALLGAADAATRWTSWGKVSDSGAWESDAEVHNGVGKQGVAAEGADDLTGDISFLGHRSLFETGSGSGEQQSGDDQGSGSGVVPSPSPPPSPIPPPSPPFLPGTIFVDITVTRIVITMTLDYATPADFTQDARDEYVGEYREYLSCFEPACSVTIEVYAGSVIVRTTVIVSEEDASVDATAVATAAQALEGQTTAELSTLFGVPVEEVPTVAVETGVPYSAAVAPPPPPGSPPSAPDDGSSGLATGALVGIIIGCVFVLLAVSLICYRKYTQNKSADVSFQDAAGRGSNFPIAIGASTTQHV